MINCIITKNDPIIKNVIVVVFVRLLFLLSFMKDVLSFANVKYTTICVQKLFKLDTHSLSFFLFTL